MVPSTSLKTMCPDMPRLLFDDVDEVTAGNREDKSVMKNNLDTIRTLFMRWQRCMAAFCLALKWMETGHHGLMIER